MGEKHLKGWLEEARKEKAVAVKSAASEGAEAVIGGTGGEDMEDKRGAATEAMAHWEKVVDLVGASFG